MTVGKGHEDMETGRGKGRRGGGVNGETGGGEGELERGVKLVGRC